MRVHSNWSTDGFALTPVASHTSVFPSRGFLETWWNHFGTGELRILEAAEALVPLWHRPDGVVAFVGDSDLTDYHSPLGSASAGTIAGYLAQLPGQTAYHFDSLPGEAAEALGAILVGSAVEEEEAAYRLTLPGSADVLWQSLTKKERHELRRKRRRFTESLGEPRLLQGTQDPMGVFAEMHRMAPGEKGRFMTKEREAFLGPGGNMHHPVSGRDHYVLGLGGIDPPGEDVNLNSPAGHGSRQPIDVDVHAARVTLAGLGKRGGVNR